MKAMKRDPITGIRYATALLLLAAAGCSKDEVPEERRPSEGLYPLEISAVTLRVEGGEARPWGAQTRVSENTDGTGSLFDAGDTFGVQIEGAGQAGTYAVQADGSVTAETLAYWPDQYDHNVIAWYPATDGTLDLGDQSQELAYLLYGTASGNSGNAVTLTFAHQLAKVRVTPAAEALAEVQSLEILTNTTCTYEKGELNTSDQAGWVKMKRCEYDGTVCWEANVTPGCEITQLRVNGTEERDLSQGITPVKGKFYNITLNKKVELPPYTYDEATNTYTVNTAEGLAVWADAARTNLSTNCILGADITLEVPDDGSDNWTPVGGNGSPYTGSFDGAGHTISNLKFNTSENIKGMFGYINGGARISNLELKNVDINCTNSLPYTDIGAIAGWAEDATIVNCTVSGKIIASSGNYVGGIIGEGGSATRIYGCQVIDAEISGNTTIGGVAGSNEGVIVACTVSSKISAGQWIAGGITGPNSGTITACCFSGNLSISMWSNKIGGIASSNSRTITACYWDTYDGNGVGSENGGDATKVDGSSVTWATAIDAMNAAIESWNASNTDHPCDCRFTGGSDGRPVIE